MACAVGVGGFMTFSAPLGRGVGRVGRRRKGTTSAFGLVPGRLVGENAPLGIHDPSFEAAAKPPWQGPSRKGSMMIVHTGARGWAAATALAALVALPAAAGPARIESLVAAERAFSALSVQKGIKPSFLAYLAPDAVVFRPTAMNGPKTIAARPAPTATLVWEPAYAEISSAGDLGCTTGPWEMHPMGLASAPVAFVHFISVWKKQADGAWRVAVDIGTSHGKPASGGVGSGEFVAGPAHAARAVAPAALRRLDVAYLSAAPTPGLAPALTKNPAQDVRF